jgi:hypothetical protein
MRLDQPEASRLEAEGEFWERIYGDSTPPIATATAPALIEWLRMAIGGEIKVDGGTIFALSSLYDQCEASEEDAPDMSALKSELRALIEARESWYWTLFETHPDAAVSGLAADLVATFGRGQGRMVEVLFHQFGLAKNPHTRSGIISSLRKIHEQCPDWEPWLLEVARTDVGLPQFHAAALAAAALGSKTPAGIIEILRGFVLLCDEGGIFTTFSNLLFEACAAISYEDGISVLESNLRAMKDIGYANQTCRALLIQTFQTETRPLNLETSNQGPGGGDVITWCPKRRYSHRKKLSTADRARLYKTIARCERLWFDERGRPVTTNLFQQFGLPGDRESMRPRV